MRCIQLAIDQPANKGDMRVFNQFTEMWSVNDIAGLVTKVGEHPPPPPLSFAVL